MFMTMFVEVINATTTLPSDKSQMSWLKTTVYAVIGCTVGTVLLISVIVVIVFRFRMKSFPRSAERMLRQYHRTVHSQSRQDNNQSGIEMDPFLSTSSTYGNIIVNVNNGIQYIPRSEFVPVGVPPSYSDVEREISVSVRRGSPPPVYSTLDRNPPREVINFNNYIIHDSSIASACAPCLPSLSRDSSILSEVEVCVQQTRPTSNTCSVSVQTSSDEPEMEARERHSPACQCQSISVQNGAIVLTDVVAESDSFASGRSGPGYSDSAPCGRVCQLNVQDGAIVFTTETIHRDDLSVVGQTDDRVNQSSEGPESRDGGSLLSENGPAQIQVEGGQIVLRGNSSDAAPTPLSQQTEEAPSLFSNR